ncbi:hypothetical protein GA0061103_0597 [Rhizobium multihospitium]|uniref:Saccharopine dehydrogenase NADP binding domain-containing protein n=2 Tax=Rhizobium multihospitium TaxID=410764 RepID=A0A1C3XB25_9HYPH|nr:hypothetical protein GA0061103_0597 [Rhizobium multihospitium]
MLSAAQSETPLIMIFGTGNLCANLLPLLLTRAQTSRVVLVGRNFEKAVRLANLARFTAYNLGTVAGPSVEMADLRNVEQVAEILARIRPDIIFMGASLQAARIITELPNDVFRAIDEAQFGIWLPMHLSLNYDLMKAVKLSGHNCMVVNGAFPDAVGNVLSKVGLAPDIGVGNIGNIVPALTYSVARRLDIEPVRVRLRLIAHHYFSHYVHRFGNAGRATYHLDAYVDGQLVDLGEDHGPIFKALGGDLRRVGGTEGQILTAASAALILQGLVSETPIYAHAPAPRGLPGGYPVKISSGSIELDLDPSMPMERAIKVNEACQHADGIRQIADDGTVYFEDQEADILNRLLGYECRELKLDDSYQWAEELSSKYQKFSEQYR